MCVVKVTSVCCQGNMCVVKVTQWETGERGLLYDRTWMVVSDSVMSVDMVTSVCCQGDVCLLSR